MRPLFKLIIVLLLLPVVAFANDSKLNGKHTKEKKIEKQFDVTKNALLHIDNRYGNVDIATWNQNRIEIEVTMTTNGNNEQEVQKRLDEISVEFEATSGRVSAVTRIENQRSNWTFWGAKSNNVNIKINYLVKMPVSNSLDIKNHYGAISLNRLNGNTTLSCNYGSFIIGELNGDSNLLSFDYTNGATIGFVKNATIDADYSEYVINKAENITYKGNYSRAELMEILSNLDFNSSYGRLNIGKAKNVTGKSRYVTTTFGVISHNLDLNANYGKISVDLLKESIKNVNITAKYTSVDLTYDARAAFDLSAQLSYAGLKAADEIEFSVRDIQGSRSTYEGHYGKRNSGNKILVSSSYGGVKIQKQ
ncbi:MAG: DUF4097 domain-containing protein [Flavobacteriaceae bacterium]|nr:DUF4097 domain-containing protein [Flavobacteriaceae bacterium]